MSIFDYRANIVAKLKTSFPQLRTVETHPGKFTLEDVERLCTLAPAAYVSILEAPGTEKLGDGRVLFNVLTVVFVATRHSAGEKADASGWKIAEAIAALAIWNYFNSAVFPATDIEIDNLWTSKQEKNWVAIMAIAWRAQIVVGTNFSDQLAGVVAGETFVFPSDPDINGMVRNDPDPDETEILPPPA